MQHKAPEMTSNLLKYAVYFANSDKEKISSSGARSLGKIALHIDRTLLAYTN